MNGITLKKCTKCNNEYEATLEYFHKNGNRLHSWCKFCYNNYEKSKNKRVRNEEQKKQLSMYGKKYYTLNKKEICKRTSSWKKNNPCKIRVYNNKRRTYINKANGFFTQDDIKLLLSEQDYRCKYCGCDIHDSYHVDHIIPLSKGGNNYVENLCIACVKCNLSKGNKMPEKWYEYMKGVYLEK